MKLNKWLLIYALTFSAVAWAEKPNGVWELISGEYVDEKGMLIDYKSLNLQAVKVLSDTHFSFTTMKGDVFWASGTGTYQLEHGKYTETIKLNSFGQPEGKEFNFDAKFENGHWYNTRWKDGKKVEFEVWRRIE